MVIGGFGAGSEDYARVGWAMLAGFIVYVLYSCTASSWRFEQEKDAKLYGAPKEIA
jgi:hypothetical protein